MKVPYFLVVARHPETLNYSIGGGDMNNVMVYAMELDQLYGYSITVTITKNMEQILMFLDENQDIERGYVLLEGKAADKSQDFRLTFNGWVEDGNEQSEVS